MSPTAAVASLETINCEAMSAHTAIEQKSSKKCDIVDLTAEDDSLEVVAPQPIRRRGRQTQTHEVSTTAEEDDIPACILLAVSPSITKISQKTTSTQNAVTTPESAPALPAEAVSEPEVDFAKAILPPQAADLTQWRTSDGDPEIDDDEAPTCVIAALAIAADSDPTDQRCEMVAALAPPMDSAFVETRPIQDRVQQKKASIAPDEYVQALIFLTDPTKRSLCQSKFADEAYCPQDLKNYGHSSRETQLATSPVVELQPQLQQPATTVEREAIVPVSTVAQSTPTVASKAVTFDVSKIFTAREVTRAPTPTPFKASSQQPFGFDSTEASVVPDIDITGTPVAPRSNFIGASVVPTFDFTAPSALPNSDLTGTSAVPGINFTEASGNPFSHSLNRPTVAESSNIPAALDEEMDASLTGPALEAPVSPSTPAPLQIISAGSSDGPRDIASPIPGLNLSYSSTNVGTITDDSKADQDMEVAEDADEEDIYGMDTSQDFVKPVIPAEDQDGVLNEAIDEQAEDIDMEDQGQPEIEETPLEPSQATVMQDTTQHNSQSVTRVHPPEYYEDINMEGPSFLEQCDARRRVGARDSILAHLSAKRMAASEYREVDTPPWTPTPNDTHMRQSSSGLYQTSTEAALPAMPDVDAIIDSSQDQQNVPYTSTTQTEQGPIPGLFLPQPSPSEVQESLMRARDVQLGMWEDTPRSPVSSEGSESEYEPPPAGYVTATSDTHDGTHEPPLPPVLAHNPTTEDDMQDAPHESEAPSSPVYNDAQNPAAVQEMQDGVNEAPSSPTVPSSPVYRSTSPVYGSTSPVYGSTAPTYGSSPALNDANDASPEDDAGDDMEDDMSDASDLTELDEVEERLEAHVGGMPAPRHAGRHTAAENGQFIRSINEMGGPHQPNADERGLSRAMGVHAASRLEYDPDKPKLKRNCQSEESDDDGNDGDDENDENDEWSVQRAKRVRRLDEDIAQFEQLQLTEEQKQTLQQLLTPPLTASANSTPAPESDAGETRPAQLEQRARENENDDDDLMDNGHAVEDVRSSTFGYGHGEEIQRHRNISEDTGETRSTQPQEARKRG